MMNARLSAMICASALTFLCAIPAIPEISDNLTETQRAIHVSNRLGYGPRPGDVESITKMGVDNYIKQQLHPEQIDESALNKKLSAFDTLSMSSQDLMK